MVVIFIIRAILVFCGSICFGKRAPTYLGAVLLTHFCAKKYRFVKNQNFTGYSSTVEIAIYIVLLFVRCAYPAMLIVTVLLFVEN